MFPRTWCPYDGKTKNPKTSESNEKWYIHKKETRTKMSKREALISDDVVIPAPPHPWDHDTLHTMYQKEKKEKKIWK